MLTIGDVARRGGVTVESIRYYEKEGLIALPDRDVNGYRLYSSDAVSHIRFIKRAQEVGFTLKDIRELLSLRTNSDASCCDVRERAMGKVREMEEKIAVLTRMKSVLAGWVEECRSDAPLSQCPILDALDKDERV